MAIEANAPDISASLAGLFPAASNAAEETSALGERAARLLRPGTVVGLTGPLGSGKTQFVKGICTGLGHGPLTVTSPTFTIIHEYVGGDVPVYHIDAYRIRDADEIVRLGGEDYLSGDGICLIEWAERVGVVLPEDTVWLKFESMGKNERRISLYKPA